MGVSHRKARKDLKSSITAHTSRRDPRSLPDVSSRVRLRPCIRRRCRTSTKPSAVCWSSLRVLPACSMSCSTSDPWSPMVLSRSLLSKASKAPTCLKKTSAAALTISTCCSFWFFIRVCAVRCCVRSWSQWCGLKVGSVRRAPSGSIPLVVSPKWNCRVSRMRTATVMLSSYLSSLGLRSRMKGRTSTRDAKLCTCMSSFLAYCDPSSLMLVMLTVTWL
mmetsp:Transcript_11714/g.30336  ORF Transcript_11714/g.30336 Transcript_11714/m.30336 type:complete len:219 (+) Transcript_11714:1139-1795(+)